MSAALDPELLSKLGKITSYLRAAQGKSSRIPRAKKRELQTWVVHLLP